ncbi:MAG TPA: TetR/AcrR family transcriptional regulator [Thermogutta sp.]|nr:TetR/AcrR family transcriptional regulator [Thermogutta sp.]
MAPSLTEKCRELAVSAMKDGISQAALEVLKQYGYEGLTMDRVAEVAGIAKGSLYHYFRNKQELVTYLFDQTIEPAIQAGEEIFQRVVPAVEKLEAMVRMWFDYFSQHRALFDFLFRDPAVRELCLTSRRSKNGLAIDRFSAILRQGISEGVFRPLDVTYAAEMIIGSLQFVIERQLETGEAHPIEVSVRRLMDIVLHGIGASSASAESPSAIGQRCEAPQVEGKTGESSEPSQVAAE